MSFHLFISRISFEYDGAVEPLFDELSLSFPGGFTGVVGANGCGKSTLLKLLTGLLTPDRGTVSASGPAVFCMQEVFEPPDGAADLFTATDGYAFRLCENLKLTPEMLARWQTLSLGERKKLQIATALFQQPDILCIDEPTNHLDASGRELLLRELAAFRGIGVIVSHDRELLDALCSQCLFLEHGKATLRPGGVTAGIAAQESEIDQLLTQQQTLKRELKRTKAELQRRREKEQKSRNADCKRKLDRHDHDGKGRIDAARVSGRDRTAGDLAKLQRKAAERAGTELAELGKVKKAQYGLKIPYGCYSRRNALLELPAGVLPLGERRILTFPELVIGNRDRIALTGDNGGGKSTLLRRLLPELKLDPTEYLYMPQELDSSMTATIYSTLRELGRDDFSKVMNVVASLGSRPERVLDSTSCSPGEWRKLFFGLGVLRQVKLIVLDEPANHLDLPSIRCLEAALAECAGALLLISHDRMFLEKTCSIHWHIADGMLKKGFFAR